MKIQKQVSDKRGGKTYYKHVIVIPNDILKKAGLKGGDEVEAESSNEKIVLRKK